MSEFDDVSSRSWLARTNLVIAPGARTILILEQPQHIQQILRASFKIGTMKMICDKRYSPLAGDGLDIIAANSLVEASDKLGFGGEGDISDRLLHGDMKYLWLLRDYVNSIFCVDVGITDPLQCMHRISADRNLIKKTASTIVRQHFRDVLNAGPVEIKNVILKGKYIYPEITKVSALLFCMFGYTTLTLCRESMIRHNHSVIPLLKAF